MSGLVGGDGLVTKRPFLLHIYVLLTLLGHRRVMNKQIYPPWGSICTKQLFFMFQMSLSSILQVQMLIFSLISKAPSSCLRAGQICVNCMSPSKVKTDRSVNLSYRKYQLLSCFAMKRRYSISYVMDLLLYTNILFIFKCSQNVVETRFVVICGRA